MNFEKFDKLACESSVAGFIALYTRYIAPISVVQDKDNKYYVYFEDTNRYEYVRGAKTAGQCLAMYYCRNITSMMHHRF